MRDALAPKACASRIAYLASRHFVPRQRRLLFTALARQVLHLGAEPLTMAAGGANSVRQRKQPADPLDLARLATHDAPALRRVIANLKESPVDRHVPPIDVQHHDVTRGDANHGVPRAAAQQMRAGSSDPRPSLRLEARGSHRAEGHAHARRILRSHDGSRDWGHSYEPLEM